MKVQQTNLPGVLVVHPAVHGDERGFFLETYQKARYQAAGVDVDFLQDNHSRSRRGVLRGLHYQLRRPQAKLVRVSRGEVYDVAVDIRRGSPTFGQWFGVHLRAEEGTQLYIPADFAHGFCVLSDEADFEYMCSEVYDPDDQRGIRWNDPALGIEWPFGDVQVSRKDAEAPLLGDLVAADLPKY